MRKLFSNIKGDAFGGITAGIVALPLALAFGVSSGLGPSAGLYGAIFLSFFAALFGGTNTQISGPTAPMTAVSMVVIAGILAANDGDVNKALPIILTVFLLGGLLQIGLGVVGFGKYIKYIPYPVVSGFMTAIGVIILVTQILPAIGYYPKEDKAYVEELFQILQKNNIDFVVEKNYYCGLTKSIDIAPLKTFSSHHELNSSFDFMFTIGGDGTILRAVTFIRNSKIPIIGINTGRLGFLATVQKEQISFAVEMLLRKEYLVKKRTLLSVTTSPEIENLASLNFALNEVTVSRKNTASMITIETYLDDEYLTSYWADGLIIATPTGSTGYSLSCGGPIITPQAKSFVLTPIAPHNLNARPLVIPDNISIKFKVSGREDKFFLSLDSRITTIQSGTQILIKKSNFSLRMVEINQQTFIKTLREKLLWGQDTRN